LLGERLHLWDEIGGEALTRSVAFGDWGLLWLLFPLAAVATLSTHRSPGPLLLVIAALGPLPCYAGLYFFSRWEPVSVHVNSSFSRLLLQTSLVAILLIAWVTAVAAGPFVTWLGSRNGLLARALAPFSTALRIQIHRDASGGQWSNVRQPRIESRNASGDPSCAAAPSSSPPLLP
jgi:hypothetical protein